MVYIWVYIGTLKSYMADFILKNTLFDSGTGIKQLEPIHDAIEAGFNHVVFIIRKDIEKEFKEVIGDRIAAICSDYNVTVDYAF